MLHRHSFLRLYITFFPLKKDFFLSASCILHRWPTTEIQTPKLVNLLCCEKSSDLPKWHFANLLCRCSFSKNPVIVPSRPKCRRDSFLCRFHDCDQGHVSRRYLALRWMPRGKRCSCGVEWRIGHFRLQFRCGCLTVICVIWTIPCEICRLSFYFEKYSNFKL